MIPSTIVIAGYGGAFYFLSLTLKSIPVGIAYAVWSGLGIIAVSVVAWLCFDQKPDFWGVCGILLIISGVIVLNTLSKTTTS